MAGQDAYVSALTQGRDAAWLLQTLGASDEYRHRIDPTAARIARSGLGACSENALSLELHVARRCRARAMTRSGPQIFASDAPLIVGQAEYGVTHRERFFES